MPYGKVIDQKKMKHAVMLYKHPGVYPMHKSYYDYTIVDKATDAYDDALKEGWYTTTTEALKNSTAKKESKLKQSDVLKAESETLAAKQETEKALEISIKAEEENEKLKAELEEFKKKDAEPKEKAQSDIEKARKRNSGGK